MFEKYLLSNDELIDECQLRKKESIEVKASYDEIEEKESNGWQIKKQYKNGSAIMFKEKNPNDMLKDRLWMIFYKMGFNKLSKNENIDLNIGKEEYQFQKSVDIIAMDDETCLFIDCVVSKNFDRVTSFSERIETMNKAFRYFCNSIKEKYGDRKCKYILATHNYLLSENDVELLKKYKISYFDDESIDYYQALVEHLNSAARYQLLGNLFSKTTIKGMDERVPAIEGKMGNLTYYSFLIEPERLLKIGYVLHRNKANHDQMPTYQRLIKKDRLKSIREYVDNGGFFPNSLIISIDSKEGKLRFEKAQQNLQGAHSRLGTLYLPKEYQTAYIIDGQHRLYGYSDSKYASTDTIPVIAFVDLDKDKQVKMFMDINENQKPVSKTLRNILNIDLNWSSDVLSKRREAIILNICQSLGENPNSPLFGRVITGEDSVNEKRCITIEYLKTAIEKTNLFNKYNKKNEITEKGLLDLIESEKTYGRIYKYLRDCLQVIADICKDEWEKGSSGYLTINNTIVGLIRVIGDITNIVYKDMHINLDDLNADDLYQNSTELLLDFADTINELSLEKRNEIKSAKGGAAKEISYRILQVALHMHQPKFTNPDLEKYIEENCTNYNEEALIEILHIKETILNETKEKLLNMLDWENLYFPEELSIKLNQKVTAQNIKNNRSGNNVITDIWNVIDFDDLCKIFNYKSNWSTLFKNLFINKGMNQTRLEIVSAIKSVQSSEAKINNGKQITKTEYEMIHKFYSNIKGVN